MEATLKPSLLERFNVRMVFFGLVVLLVIGFPVYYLVQAATNKGISYEGGVAKVDLKRMGNFNFDQSQGTLTDIPPEYRALDGKRVVLEGYMYSGLTASGKVNRFQLVYSIANCCFNGPPQVQERVFGNAPKGVPLYSSSDLVRAVGTLRVAIKKDQGLITSVYELDVDSIEAM